MNKILVVCGPTATGKTALAVELAKKFSGEIISADSRQVYVGMDIVTGKDLPPGARTFTSNIKWRDRFLKYYVINHIKVWLYDVVNPDEPFNVAYWKEAADAVIADIHLRGRLPIVVGGTGLYIKSLFSDLTLVRVPPNNLLRKRLADKDSDYLFNYLNRLDSVKAASLNSSDRKNPRRLVRAIEIAAAPVPESKPDLAPLDLLILGLIAEKTYIFSLIKKRISQRLIAGALSEIKTISRTYGSQIPAMTALGYKALSSNQSKEEWTTLECQYVRRQVTWFKKQPGIIWFDISRTGWRKKCLETVQNWYNKNRSS
jgi:tRNA dimethylallyltransferase